MEAWGPLSSNLSAASWFRFCEKFRGGVAGADLGSFRMKMSFSCEQQIALILMQCDPRRPNAVSATLPTSISTRLRRVLFDDCDGMVSGALLDQPNHPGR